MAEIIIAKTKLRRGTDEQRQLVVFDQGEPVFTTDTKRLFIGIGTTAGGVVVGSKVHPPLVNYYSLSTTNAQVGDLVYANNKFYELTDQPFSDINNWVDVNLKVNPNVFSYDSSNTLQLKLSGLSAFHLDPNTIGYGLVVEDNRLSVKFNPTFFSISAANNALTLNDNSITEFQINSSSLSSGIKGGSGNKIELNIDTRYFRISSNVLTVRLSSVDENVIKSSALGFGLSGGNGDKIQVDIDPLYLEFNGNKLSVRVESITSIPPLLPDFLTNADGTDGLIYITDSEVLSVHTNGATVNMDISGALQVNPDMFGSGLDFNLGTKTVSSILTDVDNNSIVKDSSGVISLSNLNLTPVSASLVQVFADTFGRVTSIQTAMYDLIQIDTNNPLLSVFNGAGDTDFNPYDNLENGFICQVEGTSVSDLSIVSLSSAGFMAFAGEFPIRGDAGMVIKRFAIPIYTF